MLRIGTLARGFACLRRGRTALMLGAIATRVALIVATAWLWVKHIIPRLVGSEIVMLVPALSCLATVALVLAGTVVAGRAAAASASGAAFRDGPRSD